MTQYVISVLTETDVLATDDEMATIDVFNDKLQADGQWVFAAGLASPASSTVVDGRRAEPVFTDGPFVESKEFIAGFWIIEAPDLDAALAWAEKASAACEGPVEVRPFQDEPPNA